MLIGTVALGGHPCLKVALCVGIQHGVIKAVYLRLWK